MLLCQNLFNEPKAVDTLKSPNRLYAGRRSGEGYIFPSSGALACLWLIMSLCGFLVLWLLSYNSDFVAPLPALLVLQRLLYAQGDIGPSHKRSFRDNTTNWKAITP